MAGVQKIEILWQNEWKQKTLMSLAYIPERERRDDGEDEDDATEMAEYHIKPFEKRRKSKVQSGS